MCDDEGRVRVVTGHRREVDRIREAHVDVGCDAHAVVDDEVRAKLGSLIQKRPTRRIAQVVRAIHGQQLDALETCLYLTLEQLGSVRLARIQIAQCVDVTLARSDEVAHVLRVGKDRDDLGFGHARFVDTLDVPSRNLFGGHVRKRVTPSAERTLLERCLEPRMSVWVLVDMLLQ